jgi:hypothetical protein
MDKVGVRLFFLRVGQVVCQGLLFFAKVCIFLHKRYALGGMQSIPPANLSISKWGKESLSLA